MVVLILMLASVAGAGLLLRNGARRNRATRTGAAATGATRTTATRKAA
jgi:hypothetical protein